MGLSQKELDSELKELVAQSSKTGAIDPSLYVEYEVKRGLRDNTGRGVLTGLTEISDVNGIQANSLGEKIPAEGRLYYRGYSINDLIRGIRNRRFGFEEITYLLLFGELPTESELDTFIDILSSFRRLPDNFIRDVIMKAPSRNMMNSLQQSILTLYSYDDNPDDISVGNVLKQSLSLIAKMPLLAVYSYHTYRHYHQGQNLVIRNPKSELSLAENLLQMLHPDGQYTQLEAKVLDIALILHAEHGGGNNSTFTTHVVSSTGTDTYSAIAASLGSLKGPKHGGANLKVLQMFADIKKNVHNWDSDEEIRNYLNRILDHQAFDGAGLIYGMGHAVYTLSDPRCVILKEYAKQLSVEKDLQDEYALYEKVEQIGKECMQEKRRLVKPVCANVDFYSGFVYSMLDFPKELFTPIFAVARISGWSAHRLEEIVSGGKIIRPAYKYVGHHRQYISLESREKS
ncbi:MAG: citrate/2-methylcitrate synthase [Eubacteriales bacterium]